MKKYLLLLIAIVACVTGWAEDYYITDVMVIGGSKREVDFLKVSYMALGWTVIDQDLNAGCSSSSDYIYLLYKNASESTDSVGAFITDFYITDANGTVSNSFNNGGRTFYLVPFDGSDYFKSVQGDLNSNCGSGSANIHLYYTKDYASDGTSYKTVKAITFNATQSGGIPNNFGRTGYDLNTGCGSGCDYIYMHTDKSQGWIFLKNSTGTECIIQGFDGPKKNIREITAPVTIDDATVLGFPSMTFSDFTNLETICFSPSSSIEQMPSMEGCSKLNNVQTGKTNYKTPPSMTNIPGHTFAGTAIEKITFTSVTSVGAYIFSGCDTLSSVTFEQYPVLIDYSAFSNINDTCIINYSGSIEDWSPLMYMYSPKLIIRNGDSWACGWCGGINEESHNQLYWTLTDAHLKISSYGNWWMSYPDKQVITFQGWLLPSKFSYTKKNITLEHVYSIGQNEFKDFKDLENVYADSTLHSVGNNAFSGCTNLRHFWFDGNQQQWNALRGTADWLSGLSQYFSPHWHCMVTFNNNGYGIAPDPQYIQWSNRDRATEPTAPTADGYEFKGWFTDADCTDRWYFIIIVESDTTLYAKWVKQQFAITMPESFENGSVTCDKAEAAEGDTVTLIVTPSNGYELDSLTVTTVDATSGAQLRDDVDLTEGDEPGTYTFTMPAAPVTVNATFKETTVTDKPGDANGDGNVDVNDVTTVINYILDKNPDPFIFDNANVNGDTNIDVNDVTMIINMILGIIQ